MTRKPPIHTHHPLYHAWLRLIPVIIILITLLLTILLVNQPFHFFSKAAVGDPDIFFEPQSVNLPPNSAVKLFLNTKNQPIGFIHLQLKFDPAKINLTQEIVTHSFNRVIQKSSQTEANRTGKIILVLAVEPGQQPPGGTVEIAQFAIKAKNKQTGTSSIQVESSAFQQLVTTAPQNIAFNSLPLTLSLNQKTPKPTPAPRPRKQTSSTLRIKPNFLTACAANRTYTATVTAVSSIVPDNLNVEITNLPKGVAQRPCTINYTATQTIASCKLEGALPQGGLSRIKVTASNKTESTNRSIPLFIPRIGKVPQTFAQ